MGWYIQSSRKKSILEIFVDQIMLKAAALISYFWVNPIHAVEPVVVDTSKHSF